MRNIRLAWGLLALAVGTLGLIATWLASWPAYQFTGCEKDPGADPVACYESVLDNAGLGLVVVLLLPAAGCLVPVLLPRKNVAWATTRALAIVALVSYATVGGAAALPAVTAVSAGVLAAGHSRLTMRRTTAGTVNGSAFIDQLRRQQNP